MSLSATNLQAVGVIVLGSDRAHLAALVGSRLLHVGVPAVSSPWEQQDEMQRLCGAVGLVNYLQVGLAFDVAPAQHNVLMRRLLADEDGHLVEAFRAIVPALVLAGWARRRADHQLQLFHVGRRHLGGMDKILHPRVGLAKHHLQT